MSEADELKNRVINHRGGPETAIFYHLGSIPFKYWILGGILSIITFGSRLENHRVFCKDQVPETEIEPRSLQLLTAKQLYVTLSLFHHRQTREMYCLQWLIPVLLIPKPVNPAFLYNHAMFMVLYLTGFFLERKPCTVCSLVFLTAVFLICYSCNGNCLFWSCDDCEDSTCSYS